MYGSCLSCYADVVRALLGFLPDAYATAMQQAPATQQAVLSVLLDRCLPLLAADCSPETLANDRHQHMSLACFLAYALHAPCLARQLVERLGQPQGSPHIQQALQVVAALPLQRSPASVEGGTFGEQHAGAAALLTTLCRNSPACLTSGGTEPARQLLVALPHVAAVLAALAANSSVSAAHVARFCTLMHVATKLLLGRQAPISSDSQLGVWAAACDAAVRLVPSMLQLHERCQSLDKELLRPAPLLLSQQLVGLLDEGIAAANYTTAKYSATKEPSVADEQLVRQLWALHTSMCRLVAWLAADPSSARAAMLPGGEVQGTNALLAALSRVRFVLMVEGGVSVDQGGLR